MTSSSLPVIRENGSPAADLNAQRLSSPRNATGMSQPLRKASELRDFSVPGEMLRRYRMIRTIRRLGSDVSGHHQSSRYGRRTEQVSGIPSPSAPCPNLVRRLPRGVKHKPLQPK